MDVMDCGRNIAIQKLLLLSLLLVMAVLACPGRISGDLSTFLSRALTVGDRRLGARGPFVIDRLAVARGGLNPAVPNGFVCQPPIIDGFLSIRGFSLDSLETL